MRAICPLALLFLIGCHHHIGPKEEGPALIFEDSGGGAALTVRAGVAQILHFGDNPRFDSTLHDSDREEDRAELDRLRQRGDPRVFDHALLLSRVHEGQLVTEPIRGAEREDGVSFVAADSSGQARQMIVTNMADGVGGLFSHTAGSWTKAPNSPSGPDVFPTRAAMDARGVVHLVHAMEGIHYAAYDGARWTNELVDGSKLALSWTRVKASAIAVGPRGRVHLAYILSVGDNRDEIYTDSGPFTLMYAVRQPRGGWRVEPVPGIPAMEALAIAADGRGAVHLAYVSAEAAERGHLTVATLPAGSSWREADVVPLNLKPRLNQRGAKLRGCDHTTIFVDIKMTVGPEGAAHLAYATQTTLGHAALQGRAWEHRIIHQLHVDPTCEAVVDAHRATLPKEPPMYGPKPPSFLLRNFGVLLPPSCYPTTLLWGTEGLAVDEEGSVHLLFRQREFRLVPREAMPSYEEDDWRYVYRTVPPLHPDS